MEASYFKVSPVLGQLQSISNGSKSTIQSLFCRHSAIILYVYISFKRLFIDAEKF